MKKALIDFSGRKNSGPVIGLEMAKALSENGYEVYAIVAKDTLNIDDWNNEKRIREVYTIKTYTNIKNFLPSTISFVLSQKKVIRKHFKEDEFDLIVKPIFHPWAEDIINCVQYKQILTICHDPIMHSGESIIKHILYKRHIKNSDIVVVLTKSFMPIVCREYGFKKNQVYYMPHGLMKLYREKQNHQKDKQYKDNNINFLFFGRIEKYKGISVLLKAFYRLKRKYDNVTLTIAGNGNNNDVQTELIPDGVVIDNRYIPDDEVGCYFDGPNVVTVLPYIDATQSGVIPIALEYGTPIIASSTGGLKEQLSNGLLGVFVRPGDADDLMIAMERFVNNKEMLTRETESMISYARNLEWKEVVGNLLEQIDSHSIIGITR